MEHRHLDLPGLHPSPAAVASILERGGASDIWSLLRVLRRDPHGPLADAALQACRHSDVYGYPALVELFIETCRQETGPHAAES